MDNKCHINASTVNKLIDMQRILHSKAAKYTFLSSANGTFSSTDHILGPKTSLSKFKKIEIVLSILSHHNIMRLEIRNQLQEKRNCNTHRHMEAKQYTTEPQMERWRNQGSSKKKIIIIINKYLERRENKNKMIQKSTGHSKSSSNREGYDDTSLPQETRKKSDINNLTLHLNELKK